MIHGVGWWRAHTTGENRSPVLAQLVSARRGETGEIRKMGHKFLRRTMVEHYCVERLECLPPVKPAF